MKHSIHIPLIDHPSGFRVTEAAASGEGKFRILGRPADGERWQFHRGEIVECVSQTLPDGTSALVAVHSCSQDPEYRRRRMSFAIFGMFFGALLGAVIAILLDASLPFVVFGAALGATILVVLSVRWRDAAWRGLSWVKGLPWL